MIDPSKSRKAPPRVSLQPQGDMFRLDSQLTAEVYGERSLMAFLFFALSKNVWVQSLAYQ